MALIDQRILIDAPPDVVWAVLADASQLVHWHAGCRKVAVLTTSPIGVGARRRCTSPAGKDVIEEITAWVEGRGYEYTLISGSPYRRLQGRLRLQASPDGTSVQWTISYQPKGLLGLLRNQFGGKRQLEEMVATSLRQLRRLVDARGQRMDDDERAKVAIRGRLNANERAQYQRRYQPPAAAEGTAPADAAPAPTAAPPEAAPSVSPAAELPEDMIAGTAPSFVAELAQEAETGFSEPHKADTQPKAPAGLREMVEAQQQAVVEAAAPVEEAAPPPEHQPFMRPASEAPAPAAAPEEEIPDHKRITPPRGIPAVKPSAAEVLPPPVIAPPGTPATPSLPTPKGSSEATPTVLPPPTPKTDTGEISIWEVFGLRRPSEEDADVLEDLIKTVQTREIKEMRLEGRLDKRPVPVRRLSNRLGLRLRLALKAVRVRLHHSGPHP